MNELVKSQTDIEARLADAHRFEHARVAKLAEDDFFVKLIGRLSEKEKASTSSLSQH